MENSEIKQALEVLNESVKKQIEVSQSGMATKADVENLNKSYMNLMAAHAAKGNDPVAETKAIKGAVNEAWKRDWERSTFGLMEKTRIFDQLALSKEKVFDIAKGMSIAKVGNVSEYDAAGGAGMLQTLVDDLVYKIIPLYGVARRNVKVVSGIRGNYKINNLATLPSFGFTLTTSVIRDDATMTADAPTFANNTLTPKQAGGLVKIPEKTIFDAVPNVIGDTAEDLAWAAGIFEDTVVFKGSGVTNAANGGITGFCNATIGYGNKTISVRTGSFTSPDSLLACRTAVHPGIAQSADLKYHMHPFTYAYLSQQKASTSGLYFFDPQSQTFKVSGATVEFNQVMDTVNASGLFDIGAVPVLFGDLKKAGVLGLGRDQSLRTSLERYFDTNEIALKLTYDLDFAIPLPAAVTKVVVVS